MKKFEELPFDTSILNAVRDAEFEYCTEVQEKVLPVTLTGKDVMVQSKTGSGKTAVFVLSILQEYIKSQGKLKALILAPTRELAVQIAEDAKKLSKGVEGFSIGCFYGGVGYENQIKEIENGCSLYVGTPGRILDLGKMGRIDFRIFDIFVLDEADRMFDMGFFPDIQKIFSKLRKCSERQTMLFSATLSLKVRNLAWSFMDEPVEFEIQPEEITVKNITQELYHVSKDEKFMLFLRLMVKENPDNCLIFTNTKHRAVEIAGRLTDNGFPTRYLMGDMPQAKRLKTIDMMKVGKLKFLVATDVAARGLQIDDLQLVVNYDIPEDFESYVHRIGRTARAGKSGKAITLACEEYIYGLEAIENYIQMKIPVIWPEEDELPEVVDKSEGKHYGEHSDRDRRPSDRNGSRNSRGPRQGQDRRGSSSRPSQNRDNRKPRQSEQKKDYGKMQSMSLEERLEMYKKQYATDDLVSKKPQQNVQKKNSNSKSSPNQQNRQRKPQGQRPVQQKPAVKQQTPAAKPAEPVKAEQPKKKRSFLDWLLGRNK